MEIQHPTRLRLGAVALGVSALLLAVFPLVRPFFRLDLFSPALADVASAPLASGAWLLSHLMATAAFVLLPGGLLALHAALSGSAVEPLAFRGAILGLLGSALVLPALGVETYAMPVVGGLYLGGARDVAPMLALIYRGPMTLALLLGLALLAAGALALARAIWRSRLLPRWAGATFAIGLALWLPLLPRPIRVVDGLLIGLGGIPLAWHLWRAAPVGSAAPAGCGSGAAAGPAGRLA